MSFFLNRHLSLKRLLAFLLILAFFAETSSWAVVPDRSHLAPISLFKPLTDLQEASDMGRIESFLRLLAAGSKDFDSLSSLSGDVNQKQIGVILKFSQQESFGDGKLMLPCELYGRRYYAYLDREMFPGKRNIPIFTEKERTSIPAGSYILHEERPFSDEEKKEFEHERDIDTPLALVHGDRDSKALIEKFMMDNREVIDAAVDNLMYFFEYLQLEDKFREVVYRFIKEGGLSVLPSRNVVSVDLAGEILSVPVKITAAHASAKYINLPISTYEDLQVEQLALVLLHEIMARCGNDHDTNETICRLYEQWCQMKSFIQGLTFDGFSEAQDRDLKMEDKWDTRLGVYFKADLLSLKIKMLRGAQKGPLEREYGIMYEMVEDGRKIMTPKDALNVKTKGRISGSKEIRRIVGIEDIVSFRKNSGINNIELYAIDDRSLETKFEEKKDRVLSYAYLGHSEIEMRVSDGIAKDKKICIFVPNSVYDILLNASKNGWDDELLRCWRRCVLAPFLEPEFDIEGYIANNKDILYRLFLRKIYGWKLPADIERDILSGLGDLLLGEESVSPDLIRDIISTLSKIDSLKSADILLEYLARDNNGDPDLKRLAVRALGLISSGREKTVPYLVKRLETIMDFAVNEGSGQDEKIFDSGIYKDIIVTVDSMGSLGDDRSLDVMSTLLKEVRAEISQYRALEDGPSKEIMGYLENMMFQIELALAGIGSPEARKDLVNLTNEFIKGSAVPKKSGRFSGKYGDFKVKDLYEKVVRVAESVIVEAPGSLRRKELENIAVSVTEALGNILASDPIERYSARDALMNLLDSPMAPVRYRALIHLAGDTDGEVSNLVFKSLVRALFRYRGFEREFGPGGEENPLRLAPAAFSFPLNDIERISSRSYMGAMEYFLMANYKGADPAKGISLDEPFSSLSREALPRQELETRDVQELFDLFVSADIKTSNKYPLWYSYFYYIPELGTPSVIEEAYNVAKKAEKKFPGTTDTINVQKVCDRLCKCVSKHLLLDGETGIFVRPDTFEVEPYCDDKEGALRLGEVLIDLVMSEEDRSTFVKAINSYDFRVILGEYYYRVLLNNMGHEIELHIVSADIVRKELSAIGYEKLAEMFISQAGTTINPETKEITRHIFMSESVYQVLSQAGLRDLDTEMMDTWRKIMFWHLMAEEFRGGGAKEKRISLNEREKDMMVRLFLKKLAEEGARSAATDKKTLDNLEDILLLRDRSYFEGHDKNENFELLEDALKVVPKVDSERSVDILLRFLRKKNMLIKENIVAPDRVFRLCKLAERALGRVTCGKDKAYEYLMKELEKLDYPEGSKESEIFRDFSDVKAHMAIYESIESLVSSATIKDIDVKKKAKIREALDTRLGKVIRLYENEIRSNDAKDGSVGYSISHVAVHIARALVRIDNKSLVDHIYCSMPAISWMAIVSLARERDARAIIPLLEEVLSVRSHGKNKYFYVGQFFPLNNGETGLQTNQPYKSEDCRKSAEEMLVEHFAGGRLDVVSLERLFGKTDPKNIRRIFDVLVRSGIKNVFGKPLWLDFIESIPGDEVFEDDIIMVLKEVIKEVSINSMDKIEAYSRLVPLNARNRQNKLFEIHSSFYNMMIKELIYPLHGKKIREMILSNLIRVTNDLKREKVFDDIFSETTVKGFVGDLYKAFDFYGLDKNTVLRLLGLLGKSSDEWDRLLLSCFFEENNTAVSAVKIAAEVWDNSHEKGKDALRALIKIEGERELAIEAKAALERIENRKGQDGNMGHTLEGKSPADHLEVLFADPVMQLGYSVSEYMKKDEYNASRSTVGRDINKNIERGYIEKVDNAGGRANRYGLTEGGRKRIEHIIGIKEKAARWMAAMAQELRSCLINAAINPDEEIKLIAVDENLAKTSTMSVILSELERMKDDDRFSKLLRNVHFVKGRGTKLLRLVKDHLDGTNGKAVSPSDVIMVASDSIKDQCREQCPKLLSEAFVTFVNDKEIAKDRHYYPLAELVLFSLARSLYQKGIQVYDEKDLREMFDHINACVEGVDYGGIDSIKDDTVRNERMKEVNGKALEKILQESPRQITLILKPSEPFEYDELLNIYRNIARFIRSA